MYVQNDQINVFLKDIPVHDGQIQTTPCTCHRKQGSEIISLLGMLQFCEELVQIQSMQVLFWSDQYASIAITVDFPHLMDDSTTRRAIFPGDSNRIRLHPATQALLASLRSDWKYLEMFMQGMKHVKDYEELQKALRTTVLPTRWNLEEVYQQINDSPLTKELYQRRVATKQANANGIMQFSADIWTDHIAPFLGAQELQALRQSCLQLNGILPEVVPGLKLRLFQHQKRSLAWMRSRESRIQTESDFCSNSRMRLFALEGDDYRAASGGVATLLELRLTGEQVRIHQLTGQLCDESLAKMTRTAARGGLLCDDPGLGKTITVLSLILQTAGMLPESPTIVGKSVESDKIFNAYWEEQYCAHDNRRSALLKFINQFIKSEATHTNFPPAKKLQKLAEHNYESFQQFQDDFE
jgi:SNF2 family DNA or RNA helicase